MSGYVPALDYDVEFEVTYISAQADFADMGGDAYAGGFDIRTFAIKAGRCRMWRICARA